MKNLSELQSQLNPRTISKKIDQEGRSQLLEDAMENRAAKEDFQQQQKTKLGENREQFKQVQADYEQIPLEIKANQAESAKRMMAILVRIKKLLGLKDQKLVDLEAENLDLRIRHHNLEDLMQSLDEAHAELAQESDQLPQSSELLAAYYEKVARQPLTVEQKKKLLKPEVLAELPLEEYIKLMRRLNPHFFTHVTRQGFTDHADSGTGSLTNFFADGLKNALNDGAKLAPGFSLLGLKNRSEESVGEFMGDWVFKGGGDEVLPKDQALINLDISVNKSLSKAPRYPDKTAVHFALGEVLDWHYGAEADNEVFFFFPVDVLASQHNFAFNYKGEDFRKNSQQKWNDVFVWPQTMEDPGISLNSGIVFLPKSTPVDRETGSKYASKMVTNKFGREVRSLVTDEELVNRFSEFIDNMEDRKELWDLVGEIVSKHIDYNRISADLEKAIKDKLCDIFLEMGFYQEDVLEIAEMFYGFLPHIKTINRGELIGKILPAGSDYVRAKDTITAEEYWEQYFTDNPQLRPKRIVYYDGDPTQAVLQFQIDNQIGSANTTERDGDLLGFEDNFVADMNSDPRVLEGKEELMQLGRQIIEEYYQNLGQQEKLEPVYDS